MKDANRTIEERALGDGDRDRSTVPKIEFVHVKDLLGKPAPLSWLIRDVLLCGTNTTLIGPPATFKSAVAIDMAASIATGCAWHGKPTKQGPVFVLAGEGNLGMGRRMAAWSIAHGKSLDDAPLYLSKGGIGLIDPLNAATVAAEVERLSNIAGAAPALLIVDTLARNFGCADENSTRDMSTFIANLDVHIRQYFDCAILIVHHTGVMDGGRGRGSSSLRGATDGELMMERADRTVTLRCTKAKDFAEFAPITFEARSVALPWVGEDGRPESSFAMFPSNACTITVKPATLPKNQQMALDALRSAYAEAEARLVSEGRDPALALVRHDDWRDRTGLPRNRFPEARDGLITHRLIVLDMPHVRLSP